MQKAFWLIRMAVVPINVVAAVLNTMAGNYVTAGVFVFSAIVFSQFYRLEFKHANT